jgi:hypothetical protein
MAAKIIGHDPEVANRIKAEKDRVQAERRARLAVAMKEREEYEAAEAKKRAKNARKAAEQRRIDALARFRQEANPFRLAFGKG